MNSTTSLNTNESNAKGKTYSSEHTLYHYAAIDSVDGELCSIEDITTEFRKLHKFYCLSCGEEMVANLKDDHHRRHFKHKNKTECSNETYLHNLAKKKIAKHFFESEHFYVSYNLIESCPKHPNCKYSSYYSCIRSERKRRVDLKQYYQYCEIEKQVKDSNGNIYVADICLISNRPKVPPMLIEIFVSHACSEEKRKSGLWIMEIPISSEDDINRFCKTDSYNEESGPAFELLNISKKKEKELVNDQVLRYIHFPNKNSEIKRISCKETNVIQSQDSDIELNILNINNEVRHENYNDLIEAVDFLLYDKKSTQNEVTNCEDCVHYNPYMGPQEADNHRCDLDFLRRRPEGVCTDFHRKVGENRSLISSQIKVEYIKGSKPEVYLLAIIGPQKFYNTQLIEEVCSKRLSELDNRNLALGVQQIGALDFMASVVNYADSNNIPFNKFDVDWNAKGKSAGYQSNDEVVACANELIVFNDSNDKLTQDIIQKAKSKNIPLTLIDLAQLAHNRKICPECGSKLVEKSGRYGHFWGCSNYPECKYKG